MEKPASLRAAFQAALPELAAHPEKLRLFVTAGSIEPTKGSLSYLSRYTLSIFVEDVGFDPAFLNVALIGWLQDNQPDILAPHRQDQRPITFEAEPLESDRWDVLIEVKLTETVLGRLDAAGRVHIDVKPEPHRIRDLAAVLGAGK